MRIAETLPDAGFLGLERRAAAQARLDADPALAERTEAALARLEAQGAQRSAALVALAVALEEARPAVLVVDMVEQGLDEGTQRALVATLRRRPGAKSALFLMTRSSSILDWGQGGADEAVIYCPANHSPPFLAAAHPGGAGYEAVATCLAPPEARARTAGIVAVRI
jgi:hypothetical protein